MNNDTLMVPLGGVIGFLAFCGIGTAIFMLIGLISGRKH